MAISSSSTSALRRRTPFIPLIPCSDCGQTVKRGVSGTTKHPGWIYYKCKQHGHGCNFWHWELEYTLYHVENNYLRGDAAVEALGWAEERREELQLRQSEEEAVGGTGKRARQGALIRNIAALTTEVKKAVMLLKITVAVLCIVCTILLCKK